MSARLDIDRHVDTVQFSQDLVSLHQRWQAVISSIDQLSQPLSPLMAECLHEMETALEELNIAEEGLLSQNHAIEQANSQLLKQLQRYQDLFEFAPDGYLVTDVQGQIQEANHAALELFNLDKFWVRNRHLGNLVLADQRSTFLNQLNKLPQVGRVQNWEVTFSRRPQDRFEAILTVQAMRDFQGAVEGLRWLVRDITDLKRSQAELERVKRQNLELAEGDRLKQQFLATVSHELRTPLNSIIGFSALLKQRFNDQDKRASEMVSCIHRSGKSLLTLIQDLLDFSKLKSSIPTLNPEPFDLCQLVTHTLEDLTSLADAKALKLNVELPERLEVCNDISRMRQLITNLISNAIKFTDRGSITVKLAAQPGDRLRLQVIDTGIGIAPENQAHIFKEFWQVRQQESLAKPSGTGLGLAIVQAIVQAMGGQIVLESQVGVGTTFCIDLPQRLSTDCSEQRSA